MTADRVPEPVDALIADIEARWAAADDARRRRRRRLPPPRHPVPLPLAWWPAARPTPHPG
ncbi:hypothetical protein [Longispora fulva]|uniref:Uncharacterized protein n=1 Tax=Longispora fulva TaxID=619741 RepID=A0A8J7GGU0_9ACTN|nr:hypothetical protein [Longispora fulva]MBG6137696.1 hypothetical protein [Longispora fulva]